jgi:hypothetical protein
VTDKLSNLVIEGSRVSKFRNALQEVFSKGLVVLAQSFGLSELSLSPMSSSASHVANA